MTMIRGLVRVAAAALMVAAGAVTAAAQSHTSTPFSGAKVNGGTVTHTVQNGRHVLTVSNDFKSPETPDPHWQIVDSKGRVFLLDRLPVKNAIGIGPDKIKKSITLPDYIGDVAKVQIYCSWAEAVLGEALFPTAFVTTTAGK